MSSEIPEDPPEPDVEALAAQLVERLGRTPVPDVLMQTMATFADMAGVRLGLGPQGDGPRDLAQARLSIEVLRALLEVGERELGARVVGPFREPLAALQMAFAEVASGPGDDDGGAEPEPPPPSDPPGPAPPPPPPEGGGDAASRLWTPPGSRRPAR